MRNACQRLGRPEVVSRCLGLLGGGTEDPDFLVMLGGVHALALLEREPPHDQQYWFRVWAARGLLWAGPGDDPARLRAALADTAWRVREMTCKVIARHRVGDLLADVVQLEEDDAVPRVRAAAARASRRIVEAEA